MARAYYQNYISKFIQENENYILGVLNNNNEFNVEQQQRNAWVQQIQILKDNLKNINGYIIFEYSIPRQGKRIDCVLIIDSVIFAIEFKVGSNSYENYALDQVLDYALDLKNFHEQSHELYIAPLLVATNAPESEYEIEIYEDKVLHTAKTNSKTIITIINTICSAIKENSIDPLLWVSSIYKPTPTIIEAAQALYRGHSVHEISRSDSGAINLSKTSNAICNIIEESKFNNCKSICFLTGVPGSGKTLAGLNLATDWKNIDTSAHAVFLSGNGPLVDVLREALARNKIALHKEHGENIKKNDALREIKSFIQNIHHFRDDALASSEAPINKIVIFDEAQRAWNQKQTASFMKEKKQIQDFNFSEPEFLIKYMDRHNEWAVIICLIGGGQEIHTGEGGLKEWFDAIKRSFGHWHVYMSSRLTDSEYTRGEILFNPDDFGFVSDNADLHLSVSVRSYRSEKVSALIKAILDIDKENAANIYQRLKDTYPLVITRNIDNAKKWLTQKARGTERYGIIASSGALRLKAKGINVKSSLEPINWFLNDKYDVRSSYYLEDVATEFDIQGLELDWTCVCWDADLRFNSDTWVYKNFKGTKWQDVKSPDKRIYLVNTYRVLLTRARQGTIIFVPHGSDDDNTRLHEFYDNTFNYLKSLGILEI